MHNSSFTYSGTGAFLVIVMLKTVVLLNIFVETIMHYFLQSILQDSTMNMKFKRKTFI